MSRRVVAALHRPVAMSQRKDDLSRRRASLGPGVSSAAPRTSGGCRSGQPSGTKRQSWSQTHWFRGHKRQLTRHEEEQRSSKHWFRAPHLWPRCPGRPAGGHGRQRSCPSREKSGHEEEICGVDFEKSVVPTAKCPTPAKKSRIPAAKTTTRGKKWPTPGEKGSDKSLGRFAAWRGSFPVERISRPAKPVDS